MKNFIAVWLLLSSFLSYSQNSIVCKESDRSEYKYTKTCIYKDIKVVSDCEIDGAFTYCKNEYYLKTGSTYTKVKLTELFNAEKYELLRNINKEITSQYEANKSESEECFENVDIKPFYSFDDLKLTIEDEKFEFSSYFGLVQYCRVYDYVYISFDLKSIDRYLFPDKSNKKADKYTFTDKRDGKTYRYAKFGNHVWMIDNLAYKDENFETFTYDDNEELVKIFGNLYYMSGAEKICPEGWHLPDVSELRDLKANFDEEKFNVQLGGFRHADDETYMNLNEDAYWWSSTYNEDNYEFVKVFSIINSENYISDGHEYSGYSVRCVKD